MSSTHLLSGLRGELHKIIQMSHINYSLRVRLFSSHPIGLLSVVLHDDSAQCQLLYNTTLIRNRDIQSINMIIIFKVT
jgi:hypothetical protein